MKVSSLKNFIVIIAAIALFLFTYVVLNAEIKRLSREKIIKQDMLSERLNRIEMKMVDVQKFTSEERIVKIALDSLGLVRPNENLEVILVSKEQIKQIEKLLNEKYD